MRTFKNPALLIQYLDKNQPCELKFKNIKIRQKGASITISTHSEELFLTFELNTEQSGLFSKDDLACLILDVAQLK